MIKPATPETIAQGAKLLLNNELCVFPTETVYGLGANALSADAVLKIYQAKGRPAYNPLIVHIGSLDQLDEIVKEWSSLAKILTAKFWPGPLTVVVPRTDRIPAIVSAGLDTVAVRMPAHPIAQQLLQACNIPLAAPSANRSETISPTTAEHVAKNLPDIPLIIDGGPCIWGIESTVLDLTGNRPRLLRPGALSLSALREVVAEIELPQIVDDESAKLSPGMMKRHYAPRAKLILSNDLEQIDWSSLAKPIGLLLCHKQATPIMQHAAQIELLGYEAAAYATDLYAALHRLDDAQVSTIVAELPPNEEAWLAIHNRLTRAAT